MKDLRAKVLEALADVDRAHAKLQDILAELGPDPVDDTSLDFEPLNLIGVKEAAHRFEVDETTMRRWCRDHGIGKFNNRGRWEAVSLPRLKRHLGRE